MIKSKLLLIRIIFLVVISFVFSIMSISVAESETCPTYNLPQLFASDYESGAIWSNPGKVKTITWTVSVTTIETTTPYQEPVSRAFTATEMDWIRAAIKSWDDALASIEFKEVTTPDADLTLGLAQMKGDSLNIRAVYWFFTDTNMRFKTMLKLKDSYKGFANKISFISLLQHDLGLMLGLGNLKDSSNVDSIMGYPTDLTKLQIPLSDFDISVARQLYGESTCPSSWGSHGYTLIGKNGGAGTPSGSSNGGSTSGSNVGKPTNGAANNGSNGSPDSNRNTQTRPPAIEQTKGSEGKAIPIGQSCKNGERKNLVSPQGVWVYLTCAKVKNKMQFVNTEGAMHKWFQDIPTAESGKSYQGGFGVLGGTPDYKCTLAPGSKLLKGFQLFTTLHPQTHQFLCGVVADNVPSLATGVKRQTSAPITLLVTDSAKPNSTLNLQFKITISDSKVDQKPIVKVAKPQIHLLTIHCLAQKYCNNRIATASGGKAPYHFQLDSTIHGSPPIGLIISIDGLITGTPTIPGTYKFSLCAVDAAGSQDCQPVTFFVDVALAIVPGGTQAAPVTCTYNVPCNVQLATAVGGTGPYQFSDPRNPNDPNYYHNYVGTPGKYVGRFVPHGLTINQDGKITGTPDIDFSADHFLISVRVTDAEGKIYDDEVNFQILHPPLDVQLKVLSAPQPQKTADGSEMAAGWVVVAVTGPKGARVTTTSTQVDCGSWTRQDGNYCYRLTEDTPDHTVIGFPVPRKVVKNSTAQMHPGEDYLGYLAGAAWGDHLWLDYYQIDGIIIQKR